jgi:hypothetical protein
MIKIHFISGKVKELDQPWDKFPQKLNFGGLRLLKGGPNLLIPMNSPSIEFVENVPEEVDDGDDVLVEHDRSDEEVVQQEDVQASDERESKEEEKPRTNDEMIADMVALSDCHKNKHEGREMEIWYQETTVGKQKAKAKRYFPVCSFCGVRERYVKAGDLTDEQKENAKVWDK